MTFIQNADDALDMLSQYSLRSIERSMMRSCRRAVCLIECFVVLMISLSTKIILEVTAVSRLNVSTKVRPADLHYCNTHILHTTTINQQFKSFCSATLCLRTSA